MAVKGALERQTRQDIKSIGTLKGIQPSLAELAYSLAKTIDEGAGLATAAVARELRATMTAITEVGDVNAAGADLMRRLSAPVHDPANKAGDVGGAGRGDLRAVGDAADAVATPRRRRRTGDRPG